MGWEILGNGRSAEFWNHFTPCSRTRISNSSSSSGGDVSRVTARDDRSLVPCACFDRCPTFQLVQEDNQSFNSPIPVPGRSRGEKSARNRSPSLARFGVPLRLARTSPRRDVSCAGNPWRSSGVRLLLVKPSRSVSAFAEPSARTPFPSTRLPSAPSASTTLPNPRPERW